MKIGERIRHLFGAKPSRPAADAPPPNPDLHCPRCSQKLFGKPRVCFSCGFELRPPEPKIRCDVCGQAIVPEPAHASTIVVHDYWRSNPVDVSKYYFHAGECERIGREKFAARR